jgi:hypothetical protein
MLIALVLALSVAVPARAAQSRPDLSLAGVLARRAARVAAIASAKPRPIPLNAQKVKITNVGVVDPTSTLTADKRVAGVGEHVIFTQVVSVPTSETQIAYNVVSAFQPCSFLTPIGAQAPVICENSAVVAYQNIAGVAQTPVVPNSVRIRISGKTQPVPPAGNQFVVSLGDLGPGDSATVTYDCQVKS